MVEKYSIGVEQNHSRGFYALICLKLVPKEAIHKADQGRQGVWKQLPARGLSRRSKGTLSPAQPSAESSG